MALLKSPVHIRQSKHPLWFASSIMGLSQSPFLSLVPRLSAHHLAQQRLPQDSRQGSSASLSWFYSIYSGTDFQDSSLLFLLYLTFLFRFLFSDSFQSLSPPQGWPDSFFL